MKVGGRRVPFTGNTIRLGLQIQGDHARERGNPGTGQHAGKSGPSMSRLKSLGFRTA